MHVHKRHGGRGSRTRGEEELGRAEAQVKQGEFGRRGLSTAPISSLNAAKPETHTSAEPHTPETEQPISHRSRNKCISMHIHTLHTLQTLPHTDQACRGAVRQAIYTTSDGYRNYGAVSYQTMSTPEGVPQWVMKVTNMQMDPYAAQGAVLCIYLQPPCTTLEVRSQAP